MVHIVTDSCSDLSLLLTEKHAIHTIPLSVFIDNKIYQDGIDITPDDLFQYVARSGILPKTSAPSPIDFENLFKSVPGDLLYIGIGSKLSATIQNSRIAAQNLPDRKIIIIDSNNLSSGIGLLALKAADLRDMGWNVEMIAENILQTIPKVHTSFVIDTLEYLHLGGRCSAMENIVGSMLKIRPVIEVRKDGTLGVKDKIRGSRKHAMNSLLEEFDAHKGVIDPKRVFVTHTGCDTDADYIVSQLKTILEVEEILVARAGATITSHCGPDTIGILYLEK